MAGHPDRLERAARLREVVLGIPRDPHRDLVGRQGRIGIEPRADSLRDHLELAARIRACEHGDAGGRTGLCTTGRLPRANVGEQMIACSDRLDLTELRLEITAGALDERRQRVAHGLAPQHQRKRIDLRGIGGIAATSDVVPQLLARIEDVERDVGGGAEIRQRLELRACEERQSEHRDRRIEPRRR